MKIIPCEQGSPEWIKARAGIPTASGFDRIITPKTMKPSASSHPYLCELLAERLLGVSMDSQMTEWMERGAEMEEAARSWYEYHRDIDVERVGFITTDDGSFGCSPDGLVGDDGGIEIKCPSAAVHVAYMLEPGLPDKYRCQVQGSLLVTGRAWWDFLSYNPSLPPVLVRVTRDEAFITALDEALSEFTARLAVSYRELAARVGTQEAA